MTIDIEQITGLVLAGGRGSRMGGVDKGLQLFRGKPLVRHAIDRFAPQVGTLMINANQNLDQYRAFGFPVRSDSLAGFAGPLAGLQAGLAHCMTPYLATVPCDSPFLPTDLVARLAEGLASRRAQLAMALTAGASRPQPQPVFCLLRADLLPQLDRYLEQGGRKVDSWYRSLDLAEVVFPDEAAFRNINTLEELDRHQAEQVRRAADAE